MLQQLNEVGIGDIRTHSCEQMIHPRSEIHDNFIDKPALHIQTGTIIEDSYRVCLSSSESTDEKVYQGDDPRMSIWHEIVKAKQFEKKEKHITCVLTMIH